jgi:hypothetical protein
VPIAIVITKTIMPVVVALVAAAMITILPDAAGKADGRKRE